MKKLQVSECIYTQQDCLKISNGIIEVIATKSVGPCILSFSKVGKETPFIQTTEFVIETPSGEKCPIYGGHRIWVAPETYQITYQSDAVGLDIAISLEENKVKFTQQEKGQSFQKAMELEFINDTLHLTHSLKNIDSSTQLGAIWTITMLQSGGVASMPMLNTKIDKNGLQPTQQLNLWHYTDLSNETIKFQKNEIQVDTNLYKENLKIGTPQSTGELFYHWENQKFTKKFDPNYTATFDKMSKAEIFCSQHYIELEAIGEQFSLAQNEIQTFKEIWKID